MKAIQKEQSKAINKATIQRHTFSRLSMAQTENERKIKSEKRWK